MRSTSELDPDRLVGTTDSPSAVSENLPFGSRQTSPRFRAVSSLCDNHLSDGQAKPRRSRSTSSRPVGTGASTLTDRRMAIVEGSGRGGATTSKDLQVTSNSARALLAVNRAASSAADSRRLADSIHTTAVFASSNETCTSVTASGNSRFMTARSDAATSSRDCASLMVISTFRPNFASRVLDRNDSCRREVFPEDAAPCIRSRATSSTTAPEVGLMSRGATKSSPRPARYC